MLADEPAYEGRQGFSYTINGGGSSVNAMPVLWSRYIAHRSVLRVLGAGFAIVLLLLGVACFIAVRGTRAIQKDAELVVREELTIARLLNEVQVEETAMAVVLHHLIQPRANQNEDPLLRKLESADEAVTRVSRWAQRLPESRMWVELETAAKQFTTTTRAAIQQSDRSEATVQKLFALHGRVVDLVERLVVASTSRAMKSDRELAGRSKKLADESLLVLGTCFVLAFAGAGLTIQFTKSNVERIEWQAGELGRVSWHMLQTQEESARRFSHELHDELGQSLAAIRANLEALNATNFPARRADGVHLVDEAIANVRELSQLLRPVILDDFGLDAALRWLAEKFSQRANVLVRYESDVQARLEEELETHLFRIAQEALTNVARHAQATEVVVRLMREEGSIILTVEDNGRGLPEHGSQSYPSLGMVGMRARARQVQGELTVGASTAGGVCVSVTVPARELTNGT